MLTVTLDTSILVDLESRPPRAGLIRQLLDDPRVTLQLPAIMASERQPGGGYLNGLFRK
jgi:hypothetical protein